VAGKLCEICGKRTARHVCQECGRKTCEVCLEPSKWLCSECYRKIEHETPMPEAEANLSLNIPFVKLFILGFFLIFIGMVILIVAALISGSTESFSFFVIIGFIPIVFGAGQDLFWPLLFAIILTVLSIGFFIILWKRKVAGARRSEKTEPL